MIVGTQGRGGLGGGGAPAAPGGMGLAIPGTEWDNYAGDLAGCLI